MCSHFFEYEDYAFWRFHEYGSDFVTKDDFFDKILMNFIRTLIDFKNKTFEVSQDATQEPRNIFSRKQSWKSNKEGYM